MRFAGRLGAVDVLAQPSLGPLYGVASGPEGLQVLFFQLGGAFQKPNILIVSPRPIARGDRVGVFTSLCHSGGHADHFCVDAF